MQRCGYIAISEASNNSWRTQCILLSKMLRVVAVLFATVLVGRLHPAAAQGALDGALAAAEDASTETLAGLYTTIRNIALPPTSADATGDELITQRLVLLLPGKVLNYYDYFPGNAYEAALEDPDFDGTQVVIPPRVMENMFAVADVVSGRYPLRGAESGESMSLIYENLLNRMEVKGFTEKTQEEKERYLVAIDYLAEEIPDPLNVEQNVTRFQLYRRSQDLYNQKRREMEDTIAEMRRTLPAIEYELWFQRNYPTLNSQVEGAYTEWLIFGEKAIVELYKAYLDTEGPAIELEEARMVLRAAGVTSLDRSRTIYPVSFVPSNWYRYLVNVTAVDLARQNNDDLTRDELQSRIGELLARKRVLETLMIAEPSEDLTAKLDQLLASLNTSNTELAMYSSEIEELRQDCLSGRLDNQISGTSEDVPECEEYELAILNATSTILSNSELYLSVSDLNFQINNVEEIREAINQVINEINEQITELHTKLITASVKLFTLARHAADSQDQLDSQWLQFEFDSAEERRSSESRSSHFSTAASFGASGGLWSARGSFSYSRSEASFESAMNSADITVKGELLRVTIQRPWFRPSIFRNQEFVIRDGGYVSPGPKASEAEFIEEIVGSDPTYLLPEYVTGLLLSRNIELEFKNIEVSQAARAVSVSHRASLSGGFGPWRASFSYSYGRQERSFNAESSSNGLRISIPGAQIIGYYTQVVPKFPAS